jgi:ergot alkaloid biosynthesis protein
MVSAINTVLVTGGTGKTGAATANALRRMGARVASRTRKNDSSDWIAFDWMDPATHEAALQGVDGVYLIAPIGVLDPVPPAKSFIEMAQEKGVRRFVLLSSSAIPEGGPAMGGIHALLKSTTSDWAVLQPSWFMQNFSEGHHGDSIRSEGAIYSATGKARVAFIDALDIGEAAAACFVHDRPINEGLILTGPEALSYDEIAKAVSKVAKRTVKHVRMSNDELADRFIRIGMAQDYAAFLAGLDEFLATGAEDRTTNVVKRLTGRAPRKFAEFARDAARAWR